MLKKGEVIRLKNYSLLTKIRSRMFHVILSTDIASKLSRMLGASVEYWLNLQKTMMDLLRNFNH